MNCYVTSYSQLDDTILILFVRFRGQESDVSFKSMFTEMHTFDQCPLHTNFWTDFWTNVCAMACMYINSQDMWYIDECSSITQERKMDQVSLISGLQLKNEIG